MKIVRAHFSCINLHFIADVVAYHVTTYKQRQKIISFHLRFVGKLLSALLSGLSDRSASVRKSYATAIGHLVKVKSA